MITVNLMGGPSSGKSTIAAELFAKMKKQHMSVELVDEYAKQVVYSDQGHWLVNAADYQVTLTAQQLHRLWILRNHVDYAIMDSPLLLPAMYVDKEWECYEEFVAFIVKLHSTYESINIFLERPDHFETGGRVHNLEQSIKVDEELKHFLATHNIHYTSIKVDENVTDSILEVINEFD